MVIEESVNTRIKNFILQNYPCEACGIIYKDDFIPFENIAENKEFSFKFEISEYIKYAKETQAIIHSHCKDPNLKSLIDIRTPSLADRLGQRRTKRQWFIYGTDGMDVTDGAAYPHIPNNTFLKRRFIPYINDCFTLLQDYIQFELNKIPPDYEIEYDWHRSRDLNKIFEPFLHRKGFTEVKNKNDITNGDVAIVNNNLAEMSHLVIYHNGRFLHQDKISRFVSLEAFDGNIVKILRWEGI